MSATDMVIRILRGIKRRIRYVHGKMVERFRMCLFGTDEWYSFIQWNTIRHEYKLFEFKRRNPSRVIIYMTEHTEFAGLADRLRGFVSGYILAQENNRSFHLYHDKGFNIETYLEPNETDWRLSPADISRGLNRVAFLWFTNHWPKLDQKDKEYHGYGLFDLIPHLPAKIQGKYTYGGAFNKLFRPTPYLQGLIGQTMRDADIQEGNFIAFHLRFLNFFEPVEMNRTEADVTGTPEQQRQMIAAVHATIDRIYRESRCDHVLLFSDSNRFLQAPHPAYIKVLPGTVGHIARHDNTSATTDKAFVDLFVMSKAAQVYSITGPHIYGGAFSRTAAAIGGKELISIPYQPAEQATDTSQ